VPLPRPDRHDDGRSTLDVFDPHIFDGGLLDPDQTSEYPLAAHAVLQPRFQTLDKSRT
jgi:hypothetical protein